MTGNQHETPSPEAAPSPAAKPRRRGGIWRWLAILALLFVAALTVAGYWLLRTESGRDFALNQAMPRLPAGMTLAWNGAEGVLTGPLTLHDVDLHYDDIHFTAQYLHLQLRPSALLYTSLRLDTLELRNAMLDIPQSEDKPFQLPSWPEGVMPQIDLPLEIRADSIAVDQLRITQVGEPIIDIHSIRGGVIVASGRLRANRLDVSSDLGRFTVDGDYLPARNYRSDLVATAVFPAQAGKAPARLGLVARGNLRNMNIALAGTAPAPVRVTLSLQGRDPKWRFAAATESLDLGLILPPSAGGSPAPIAFDLAASGTAGDASLQGKLSQGDLTLVIAPSHIVQKDQVLSFEPLLVEAFGGRTTLTGTAGFNQPENPKFQLLAEAQGLRFATASNTPATSASSNAPAPASGTAATAAAPAGSLPIGVDAKLQLAGTLKDWTATGDSRLSRGEDEATLTLAVQGNDQRADIRTLHAVMPTGTLDVGGELGWSPALDWKLDARLKGFDPGYFAPGWNGSISGLIVTQGRANLNGGFDADLKLSGLAGQVRERVLGGQGEFQLRGEGGEGQLDLRLGDSHLQAQGKFGQRLDIKVDLQPVDLHDFFPQQAGALQGHVRITGDRAAPDLSADLSGSGLRWDGYQAQTLSLNGHLPWHGDGGNITLTGGAITAGIPISSLRLNVAGAVENPRVNTEANSGYGSVALSGHARGSGSNWQGALESLQITPMRGEPLRLREAAAFRIAGDDFRLDNACLMSSGFSLCAQANWPGQGLTVKSEDLPLSLAQPWMPKNEGRNMTLRGNLTLDGSVRPVTGGGIQGQLRIASPDGGLRLGDRTRRELLRYDNFSFNAEFDPQSIRSRLGIGFKGDGYIDARADTGWDEYSPLQGEVYMYMSQLFWLELASPDLVRPRGIVRGHVGLRGTRGQPALNGQLLLEDFTGEFPALGLNFSEGKGSLDAQPDGSARIAASLKSGEGTLNVDGQLSWYGDAAPLHLNIRGENVLVSNTHELRAVANPDLQFSFAGKNTMVLRGGVTIPSADIDLERLDRGTSTSADVVVTDPVDPEKEASSPLDLDLDVIVGEVDRNGFSNVKINGFGLKGMLDGKIHVRARPGHEMSATGVLNVAGKYTAYGQELQISRGQLTWSNNSISDPRVNLRAERQVSDITAGIDVTGNAQNPRVQVWSNPAMQQSEALAYLMLGRSLEGVSGSQAQQVTAASAALSAGSSLLAAQLGAKLGFDDAGVSQSRALGGSVVGVGKYLSPRLYVGYGVSMVGAGQVVILKYLLQKGFDVEVESSTVENRGSINWRKEK
ncbi:MAG: translocation/assembly module TamB [Xanthomonadaceae bacterium]|nr:translocation/assembly module TamB [Xanthomonadaceae bacterium]